VFSLASMLPLYAGVIEDVNEGLHRRSRIVGFLCSALCAALAWRWYTQGHTFYTVFAVLLILPGLVDWRTPPKTPPPNPSDLGESNARVERTPECTSRSVGDDTASLAASSPT